MAKKDAHGLTGKMKAFADNYLINGFRIKEAVRSAGYSAKSDNALSAQGSKLMGTQKVKDYIEDQLEDRVASRNEVLARLSSIARGFDITEYATIKEIYEINKLGDAYLSGYALDIDIDKIRADGYGHLIKSLKQNRKGISIEKSDPRQALVDVGRSYGAFADVQLNADITTDESESAREKIDKKLDDLARKTKPNN